MSDSEKQDPPHEEHRETAEPNKLDDTELHEVHAQLMREHREPKENFAPMPLFMVFIFAGLSFWGGVYIVQYSGDFDGFVFDETVRPSEAEPAEPVEFDPFRAGERFYRRNCVACHQADGQGVPGTFPPLVDTDWVEGDKERLIKVVLHGLVGPIEVRGNTYDGVMPGFRGSRDRDIAAVLTWIRTNEWNDADEVDEELVVDVRERYAGRTEPWHVDDLGEPSDPVDE